MRKNGDTDPWKQYVWDSTPAGTDLTSLGIKGGRYLDAPAVRYYDADVDGSGIVTHYFTNDANMNVTALLDTSGDVVERYEYDAYGRAHILDADFSSDGDQVSDHAQDILFAGYLHDGETGLYHVRNRALHPGLGRWLQRDPLGYVDGMSVYEYVGSRPVCFLDATGLQSGGGFQNAPLCYTPCANAPFTQSDSPDCDIVYGPGEHYLATNLRCFCRCAGDSLWSQFVRGCLMCMRYQGATQTEAHERCYDEADTMYSRPWLTLAYCVARCYFANSPLNPENSPQWP